MSCNDERSLVREEWRLYLARLVALLPQVTLECFQIRCLDVSRDQIANMCFQGNSDIAILRREGITVVRKNRAVPVLVEVAWQRI